MTGRLIKRAGGGSKITLRRHSTLEHRQTSAPIVALLVATAATAGATVIALKATSVRGRLPHGAQFQIAGDGTVYTATADARADKAGVIAGVRFSPALAQNAALDAGVTLTRTYGDQVYDVMQTELDRELVSPNTQGITRQLELAAQERTRAPLDGDVVESGSARESVLHVDSLEPKFGYAVRWTVVLSTMPGAS